MLLERHRDEKTSAALMKLAASEALVDEDEAAAEFQDALNRLRREASAPRLEALLDSARAGTLDSHGKTELRELLASRQAEQEQQND